jgi:hypothetical protein
MGLSASSSRSAYWPSTRIRLQDASAVRSFPETAPEADLRGGSQVCGGQTRVLPSNAPDATTVVATGRRLGGAKAISKR